MLRAFFRRSARAALDLLAPRHCAGCDEPLGLEDLFCSDCESSFEPEPEPAPTEDGILVITSGVYGGALARAVQRLKYEGRTDLAAPLARRVARAVARHVGERALLVPVPLHVRKLSERGYNQSALIAGALGSELGWNTDPLALRRCRDTADQARLGRAERLGNLTGAMIARRPLDGERIVVVDDVVTTGATARSCAQALELAGGALLALAAVARAGEPKPRLVAEFRASLQPNLRRSC